MMNFSSLFQPVSTDFENPFGLSSVLGQAVLTASTQEHYSVNYLKQADILLFSLPSFNGSSSFFATTQAIRQSFYELRLLPETIIDLGHFNIPARYEDYISGLHLLIEHLQSLSSRVICLSEQTPPIALLSTLPKTTISNIVCFNNHFRSFELLKDLNKQGLKFSNFSILGLQNYLTDLLDTGTLNQYNIETIRLNRLTQESIEPYVYDADWVHFSLNVVKTSDAPAAKHSSPNGLDAQTFCQSAYLAGLGGRTHWVSVSDITTNKDHGTTAMLTAQALWLYLDGHSKHIDEHPFGNNKHIQRFIVINEIYKRHFVFYKSMLSGRWWLEIPSTENDKPAVVACSYADYKAAGKQDIPERWWRFFKRNI